ncbi:MAG: restriction endonuclease subunit S [Bacteroidales bacterium]|nr:restriction endonuclease subunit S [Bacteroidales bacterium]MCF8351527.1 restriction endonuclease subunit S [Bacteroidales bacterium]
MKLKDIAKITTGIYRKASSAGDVFNLIARDFDKYGKLKPDREPSIILNESIEKHFLSKGDILFAAKGFDNFAYVFNEEVKPAVASSMFLVLKNLNRHLILPDYLAWLLNHPNTQKKFKSMARGTNLPSISKQSLGDLEIPIPNIEKQKLIIKISDLYKKELQLKDEIRKLKDKLINQKLYNTIKE